MTDRTELEQFTRGYQEALRLTGARGPWAHDIVVEEAMCRARWEEGESLAFRAGYYAGIVDVIREKGWFGACTPDSSLSVRCDRAEAEGAQLRTAIEKIRVAIAECER